MFVGLTASIVRLLYVLMIEYSRQVNIIARREESGPIVFQDWDGGDRVGTAIAIDHIMFQIKV